MCLWVTKRMRNCTMVTELIVAILMIAAMPVFAQAQKPSAAIVTHADVRYA